MTRQSGHESAAFSAAWAAVSNCGSFTLHHYELCRKAGTTPPATPSDADKCNGVSSGTTSVVDVVHRSNKTFAYTIFACDGATCDADIYGDAAGENFGGLDPTPQYDTNTTDSEVWVLEDITGFSSTSTYYMVDNDDANASAALMYPDTFTAPDTLGLWYSVANPGTGIEEIRHAHATSSGWHRWNQWFEDNQSTEVPVTEDTPGGTYFGQVSHPYVVAAERTGGGGTTDYVRLYMQVSSGAPYSIYHLDSTDDYGSDFGITCTSGGCSPVGGGTCAAGHKCDYDDDMADYTGSYDVAQVALCSNGLDSCANLDNAAHGRIMWGYVMGGAVDFSSDSPSILFTGAPDSGSYSDVDCGVYGTGPSAPADDIFEGSWTGTAWSVPNPGHCPTSIRYDAHDPGVVPLRDGEFKAYFHSSTMDRWDVCYRTSGGTWTDCQRVTFNWETAVDGTDTGTAQAGGGTIPIEACIENLDTLVWVDGATTYEGGFARAHETSQAPDHFSEACFADSAIIYVEHRN